MAPVRKQNKNPYELNNSRSESVKPVNKYKQVKPFGNQYNSIQANRQFSS